MEQYLKNLHDLYSDDDQLVYQAILQKKDWMFRPLFLKGDFSVSFDQEGKEHFYFIEALLDDVLLFTPFQISAQIVRKKKQRDQINQILKDKFARLVFHGEIKKRETTPHFYVEYDFAKIDQKGYQGLVANFFPCLQEILIDPQKIETSLVEQIKCGLIGESGDYCLIIDKSQLLNNAYYAPVMKRIIVHQFAPREVQEMMKSLCQEKGIIYEERNYE